MKIMVLCENTSQERGSRTLFMESESKRIYRERNERQWCQIQCGQEWNITIQGLIGVVWRRCNVAKNGVVGREGFLLIVALIICLTPHLPYGEGKKQRSS